MRFDCEKGKVRVEIDGKNWEEVTGEGLGEGLFDVYVDERAVTDAKERMERRWRVERGD